MKYNNVIKTKINIKSSSGRNIPIIVLKPKNQDDLSPGILWIHGGGYFTGMKEMVYMSRAMGLVEKYNAVVVSPGYRLSIFHPYPAALNDCYDSLLYINNHCDELKIRKNQIMVGGESAGGGLCVALTMLARDKKEVNIAYQMPLYPMIDNLDTESSKDNHGKVWNTKRNHFGWKTYLRKRAKDVVEAYASPAHQTDYTNLPPTYSFVGNGEPFYVETINYIQNLQKAGVEAKIDVYTTNIHAFDMLKPKLEVSKKAIENFEEEFKKAKEKYFAEN